jgi:transcriptional regulator with XRE-family HTH domain
MPRLSTIRRRRLLGEQERARRTEVARSSVHLIESGGAPPQYVFMRKILDPLDQAGPLQVDEFRHAMLGESGEVEADTGRELSDVSDPVLAELWDGPEDDVYDRLARERSAGA